MDVIQLSSYTNNEKKAIFEKYLLPKAIKSTGVNPLSFKIEDNVIDYIINQYSREPGIRSLEKHTKKILEKVAFKIVNDDSKFVLVNKDNINNFLGNPRFMSSRIYNETPVGVIAGMAYTELGGSLIFLEAMKSSYK